MFCTWVTCVVERNPLGSTALVEIVKNVWVASYERSQGRSHSDRDGGADGFDGLCQHTGAQ